MRIAAILVSLCSDLLIGFHATENRDVEKPTPTHKSSGEIARSKLKLSLRMAGVVPFDAFREQALAATLPSARQRGTAALRLHPGTKTVLAFACSLRWLVSSFHKTENKLRRDLRAATVGTGEALSIPHTNWLSISVLYSRIASAINF